MIQPYSSLWKAETGHQNFIRHHTFYHQHQVRGGKYCFLWTHHKHPATLTLCCSLFRFQLCICNSQHLVDALPLFSVWHCVRECSSTSGCVHHHQPLVVAVDTRWHPVNAQRSLEINPECISILAKQMLAKTHSCMQATTHTNSPFCRFTPFRRAHTHPRSYCTCRETFDPPPLCIFKQTMRRCREVKPSFRHANILKHMLQQNKKLMGLTEPGGACHSSLSSPLTLVELQVIDRSSFWVRIILLGCCIWITGGASGTKQKKNKKLI